MVGVSAKERFGMSWRLGGAIVLAILAGLAVAAAPASALPLPPLTINGASPTPNGPTVNASLESDGSDGAGGARSILTVTFPSSNSTGDEITAVSGRFNPAGGPLPNGLNVDEEVGQTASGGLFNFFTNGQPCSNDFAPMQSFSCANFFGGFGPGAQQAYVIDTTQTPGDPAPLGSIDVTVKMCGQTGTQAIVADNCAPPGPTKITKAKINQQKRTASFSYKAKRAMHYECELLHNKKIKYRAACSSKKKYANALDRGKYVFVVWGVNAGGGSAKVAAKKFNIG